jgi:hypothetical protein
VISNALPAVVLSYGKNGSGAITSTGAIVPAPAAADETENTNIDDDFVSHSPTSLDAPAGEFDDIVGWLSSGILFNRLVTAGKLP